MSHKRIYTVPLFLTLLVVFLSGVGGAITPAQADGGWIAYNDCNYASGQHQATNVTTISPPTGSGTLLDQATGDSTGVTAAFNKSGTIQKTTSGEDTASGTDAYDTFYDFADMKGVVNGTSSGWWVDLTFTGLDPTKQYTFATSASRNDEDYTDRVSRFTLSGVDDATNASTSGVTVIDNLSVAFTTGTNHDEGYVARWTGIQPGSDGSFVVRAQAHSGTNAYACSVFMLQEEAGAPSPTITLSGAPLNAFNSAPGTPSAEQNYTVSGGNLTNDIEINAPADFQISMTSGGSFGSSLTLPQTDGSVAATKIYVRFNRATAGTSSGNIEHTSSGATPQNVAVSGTALPLTTWVAYNDSAWNSGEPDTNITQISIYDTTSGLLKNRANGNNTSVTAAFTLSDPSVEGTDFQTTDAGAVAASGTDAYNIFNGNVSTDGVVNGMGSYSDWWMDLTLSGLDSGKTYTFAGTTVRNNSSYTTRNTTFILSGDDAATNLSSSGVTVVDSHTIAFNTGYNSQGYIVRWVGINPGSDGTIVIRSRASTTSEISGSSNNAYGPSVFMLAEEVGTAPTIITSGALTLFSSQPGTPSAEQSYMVSGYNLTDNITITAPTDFEISTTSGSSFTTTLTLARSGGTVAATPIYVRFNRADEGISSGDITHISGAIIQNVAVSGEAAIAPTTVTFQNGIDSYTGTVDTFIRQPEATAEFSSDDGLEWDDEVNTGDDDDEIAMIRFEDIFGSAGGQIPVGATIDSATLQYRVSNASGAAGDEASVYESLVSWAEDVTWNTFGGDTGVQTDEYANLIGTASVTTANTVYTIDVTASLQRWANNPNANLGWLFLPTDTDGAILFSSEYSTVANRPKLTVAYSPPPTGPTITINGSLSMFSSEPGTPSAEQSYTVSGSNLDEDIVITAPADFQISTTSGGSFGSSLTLPQTDGTVAATTIYVRFNRATAGTSSGNITHTSAGAPTRNVAVSGTASNTATVTFQYGASGYTGTVDTFIRGTTEGDTNFSANTGLEWDDNSGTTTDEIALIRFTGIFSSDGGPIPDGATITSASLTYMTTDLSGNSTADGDPANVYESLVDWPGDTVTYNNFGGDAGVQSDEYNSTLIASALADAKSTQYTIDVTDSLQRWSDGTANYGWIFLPTADDGVTIYSSDVVTVTNRPLLAVTYTTGPVNQAPHPPVLVQPANGATGVSTSPTLEVTVTDPNTDTLNVTFYGRAVDEIGGTSAGDDFTLVAIPDTQNEVQSYSSVFYSQMQWIANNKTSQNIVFATSLGDIVNTANSTTQWQTADTGYDYLDTGNVAYSVGPGNHDIGTGSLYETYFGVSRFTGKSWYGGHDGSDNYNNYSLFSASGMDFILINLQYNATTAQLNWADARLKEYPSRRGIVVQHDILNTNDSWYNQAPYTALKDNPNLFLMLCGHMHTSSDGAAYREELGDDGHTIHIMLADYQDYPNGGDGYLRILRFSPADNKIYATTYSPTVPGSITTDPDQMEMEYDMAGIVAFEVIGTDEDVASGSNASVTWSGLLDNTEYEWYATVSDGSLTTTSSTWSFTTGSASTTYDLMVAADPVDGGTTSPAVGVHSYVEDTVVDVTASPADGYEFDYWSGACTGSGTCQVTMNADKSVTAHFTPDGILGDVNDDDAVDSTDALIVLSCDADIDTSQFCPMNCGDVNDDGWVNSTDALIILSYDADMTVPFPVGGPGCPASVTPGPGCTP